jgi:hypothetical protein
MTYTKLFSIISKPWANVNDIKNIASCGRDKASLIRDSIINDIIKSGYHLPIAKEKIVPMEYVIRYLNLNIEYITSMAQNEKLFKSKGE